jgi:predicted metal-dependent RNase
MQQKISHGDLVADTLQHFRARMANDESVTPEPYLDIKRKIQKTVDEGKRVLIDIKDSYSVQTVVVQFEYVNDRWALGKSICYLEGQEVQIPYTIHFSDLICKRMNIKVITEGENPFDQRSE